jgi:hypothetical protein
MPDESDIKFDGKMQFKKDKYILYGKEYTIEGEWLNGAPHGVCIIESKDIRGVYTLTHGKPQGGPVWWENKDGGRRVSCEYYHNGDIKGIHRVYYSE